MSHDTGDSDSSISLDLRDLEPPGPMVEIFRALAKLEKGQRLTALLLRYPIFLVPQLEQEGYTFQIDQVNETTWRVRITK